MTAMWADDMQNVPKSFMDDVSDKLRIHDLVCKNSTASSLEYSNLSVMTCCVKLINQCIHLCFCTCAAGPRHADFFTPRSPNAAKKPLKPAVAAVTASASIRTQAMQASQAAAPHTLGGSLASAAASAATITAAYENARDALLLPLSQYDPVGHACWGPGTTAAASTSLAAPEAATAGATAAAGKAAAGGEPRSAQPAVSYPAPYLHVAAALAAVDSTTKRLRIADAFTNMFRCEERAGSYVHALVRGFQHAPISRRHQACFDFLVLMGLICSAEHDLTSVRGERESSSAAGGCYAYQ